MPSARNLTSQGGQNTAEYLILLTVVVVGSISLFTVFQATSNAKLAFLSSALSGELDLYEQSQVQTQVIARDAELRAKQKKIKMKGIDSEELEYGLDR